MALVISLARQVSLGGQGVDDQIVVGLALLGIAGFVVWMLFFSGNGSVQDFLKDLTNRPDLKLKDAFPVPQFDKSVIDVPIPPKPKRKPLTYHRTADEIDMKLDNWAADLKQSLREVRAESQWLVEKYKDVPLKRAKPEAKPAAKKAAKPTAKKSAKPKASATGKPKPAAKKTTATAKKAKPAAKSKASKGKR